MAASLLFIVEAPLEGHEGEFVRGLAIGRSSHEVEKLLRKHQARDSIRWRIELLDVTDTIGAGKHLARLRREESLPAIELCTEGVPVAMQTMLAVGRSQALVDLALANAPGLVSEYGILPGEETAIVLVGEGLDQVVRLPITGSRE